MIRNPSFRKRAFTLVEVLVAVSLAGLVAAIAMGPLTALVARLDAVRRDYASGAALSSAARSIASECRQSLPRGGKTPFRTIRGFSGERRTDTLAFWTAAPLSRRSPSGTEIYALLEPGAFSEGVTPGLYRWTFPGKTPAEVDLDRLEPEAAVLVVKNAERFEVEVFDGKAWVEDYSGPLPAGISLKLGRKETLATHVDTLEPL